MEIKHLHSFRAVAEELSFINASRKLHISQPALSAQIQALENELGVQLRAQSPQRPTHQAWRGFPPQRGSYPANGG